MSEKLCINCGKPTNPTWNQRCHTCDAHKRRTGKDRDYLKPHCYSPLAQRFHASYIPEPNSGCWLWVGSATRTSPPRPVIKLQGKNLVAHRVSYVLHSGP